MKKIWLMVIAVLFVLASPAWVNNNQAEREKMQKTTQNLKEENELFCWMLNRMLNSLHYHPESYQKVAKMCTKAEEAEQLILKSEKQLKEIEQEKNETVLLQKLDNINNDLIRTWLIHRDILIFLLNVFGPLLGIEAPQETVI